MIWLVNQIMQLLRRRRAGATGGEPSTQSAPAPRSRGAAAAGPSAAARGPLALLAHQVRFDLLISLRNPRARFMTFLYPVIMLVVFNGLFGHGTTVVDGVHIPLSRFYVTGILALSISVAAYGNIVIGIATLRETGALKRRRATPVPAGVLVGGQAMATLVVAAIMAVILFVLARVLYGVGLAPGALAAVAVTALVGSLALACLGYAVSGIVSSPEAGLPIVWVTTLPLYFISGVFIPTTNLSSTLRSISEVFPIEHLANSLHLASVHSSFTAALSSTDLLVIAAWGVVAAGLAAWRFSWLPSAAAA